MEEIRKSEGLALEELEEHTVELLPDREEMNAFSDNTATATATAVQGSAAAAAANAGNVFVIDVNGE
jgi:hypothetical protein